MGIFCFAKEPPCPQGGWAGFDMRRLWQWVSPHPPPLIMWAGCRVPPRFLLIHNYIFFFTFCLKSA